MASSSRSRPTGSGTKPAVAPVDYRRCLVPQSRFQVVDDGLKLPTINYAPGGPGLPMDQLLSKDKASLRTMIPLYDDQRVATLGITSIRLVIMWPGFEYLNFFRVIYWSPPGIGGVDCAGELAIAVADTYDGFSKKVASLAPQGTYRKDWHFAKGSGYTAEVELRSWRADDPYAATITAAWMSPPSSLPPGCSSLVLPTPAAMVQQEQRPKPNNGRLFGCTDEEKIIFRRLYWQDPPEFKRWAEACAEQVGYGCTVGMITYWALHTPFTTTPSSSTVSAAEELPGPTGGLMYP